MAEDFNALSAQIDRAVSLINEAISIIGNTQTSNDNQAVIDALTLRLQGATDALSGAETPATPAPAATTAEAPATVEAAPVADEAPADTSSDTPAA